MPALEAIKAFDMKAGVDLKKVSQGDGQGGAPGDAFTPRARVTLLSWWTSQPDFTMFRASLPVLGGHARGEADYVNQQAFMTSRAIAGYVQDGDQFLVYNLVFNDAGVSSVDEI